MTIQLGMRVPSTMALYFFYKDFSQVLLHIKTSLPIVLLQFSNLILLQL